MNMFTNSFSALEDTPGQDGQALNVSESHTDRAHAQTSVAAAFMQELQTLISSLV